MADLTTLTAVKAFLALTTNGQDSLITSLIPRESRQIENYTGRTFPAVSRSEQRLDGSGSRVLFLPDTPILEITYLAIDGVEIPVSADGMSFGYQHDDSSITLFGAVFPRGRRNVVCSWRAGYEAEESAYIPTGNTPTLTPLTGGRAETNVSVTAAATGNVMTQVGNGPAAGQYTFAAGVYGFATADANLRVTMAYQYIPGPVEQTAIEMVAQDLKQRDNIGVRSRSLAGETVSYSAGSMTVNAKQALASYRKLIPV